MLDEENELYLTEPIDGPGQVTFDGVPLQDLSTDLDDMLYSCITDEYCQKNGYGNSCQGGACSGAASDEWEEVDWEDVTVDDTPQQQPCLFALASLLLPFVLCLKKK